MKISTQLSKACPSLAAITTGLLLASATANAGIIFEADFNGPGGGTGGSNDLVTLGGTGAIVADGSNVVSFITHANPFTPDGGNYLEVQRLTADGGGGYTPAIFTFASDTNSWVGWQGADILDPDGNYDITLHAAYDVFFRVNSSSGTNDMSSFRPGDLDSWNGNSLKLILNGQSGGWLHFQIQNVGFVLGTTPPAIVNFTSSSGAATYDANWDAINMDFNSGNPLTNGLVYHVAFSLDTDTNNGLTTAKLYLRKGTGELDPTLDLVRSASFNLLSSNLLDSSSLPTDQAFANQPWQFGNGWAAGGPFVIDYASPRLYDSVPATFTALPSLAALLSPLKFLSPVISSGQITLSWTGSGQLQWAPTVQGPWTSIIPAPASPYSDALVQGNRFYRLLAQ